MDFLEFKKWYDGYSFGSEKSIYNPFSVMKAIDRKKVRSYWRRTTAAESLITYVNLGGDELQDKIARLISGESVKVKVGKKTKQVPVIRYRNEADS